MNVAIQAYKKWALNPLRFRLAMLRRLPSLVFWGISIRSLSDDRCDVVLPFSFTTKNPFRSIYFGALSGAAELATGALLQMLLSSKFPHAMLVTHFEAQFVKKATSAITFSCEQGREVIEVLNSLQKPGDTATLLLHATGRNVQAEVVMQATITWSIRRK
jgi:hypothetical protein